MFCVECGKEGDVFRDGVCVDCYLKSHKFTLAPEIIDIFVCAHCESYKYKNTWTQELFSDVLQRYIKNNFKISKELTGFTIDTDCKETKDGLSSKVIITGFIDDQKITESHEVFIRLRRTSCDVCSKRFGGYFEATIQVRPEGKDLKRDELDEIILAVNSYVEELQSKGNRGLFVTDIGEEHGGLDFFISDRNAAQIIVKKIHDSFGGEIKISSKNIGMQDSKQVYRMTFLLRIPSYKKGDFIKIQDTYFLLVSISANKIKLLSLSNWDEVSLELKNIKNLKVVGNKSLVKEMIVVSQTQNDIQLMNQETYKTIEIKKPKTVEFKEKIVKTVKIDDKLFLVPD